MLKKILNEFLTEMMMYPNHRLAAKNYYKKHPTQDKLVSSAFEDVDFNNLFNPAPYENEDNQNPSEERDPIIVRLELKLDIELRKLTSALQKINSEKLKDFHSEKLAKDNWSLFSAMVEIYRPESVKEKYNEIMTIEHPDWDSYFEDYYSDFIIKLESKFLLNEHKAFYENRVHGGRQVPDPILMEKAKVSGAKKEAKKAVKEANEAVTDVAPATPTTKRPKEASKEAKKAKKAAKEAKKAVTGVEPATAIAEQPKKEAKKGSDAIQPEPKPKKTLLEQAQEKAKEKKPKKTQAADISYPVIFDRKGWKTFWSNLKLEENSNWGQFFWNCNSIGKAYLMNNKNKDKLTREYDVNQDFCVLDDDEETLRVLMFDGVSQSRAPRQWAEYLAQVYIEKKMNLIKLKNHSEDVNEWHKESNLRWNKWIEEEYITRRTHLPSWRIKNEVNSSFTTFISIEITPNKIEIANIGDSAVFCKLKSGKLNYLPNTYNHLFRPKSISTEKLYDKEDIEFLSIETDQIESLLACTDSIADYIFDIEDEGKMKKNLEHCLEKLSLNGDKFDFMAEMIKKGPTNGGWLEDDITFFSFVTNEKLQISDNSPSSLGTGDK